MTDVRTPTTSRSGEDRRYQRVLLLLVMASVMAFGSMMTIVTVALGRLATDLDSTRATLTWAVTGLMLAMAVATPLAGKLGDVRGHRKIFLIGLGGCLVTTVACGLAWDAGSLIAFRALFGLAGALVVPNSMSLMMHAYGAERRATAMGWFQFAMTGAPTIGLVIGGPLIDIIGWRNLFFAFAAITALALVASIRLLRPTPARTAHRIDYLGGVTLGLTVLAALLAITRLTVALRDDGPRAAATDSLLWLLVFGAALGMAVFIRTERAAPEPMLKLDYFSQRNFTLPMVSSALVQFAYMGGFVVVPALLEDQYLWSLGAIAVLLAPRPATFSLTSPLGGYLPNRVGKKLPIVAGAVAMMASTAAFVAASGFDSGVGVALILAGLILAGAAAGISGPSVLAMVVDNVDENDTGHRQRHDPAGHVHRHRGRRAGHERAGRRQRHAGPVRPDLRGWTGGGHDRVGSRRADPVRSPAGGPNRRVRLDRFAGGRESDGGEPGHQPEADRPGQGGRSRAIPVVAVEREAAPHRTGDRTRPTRHAGPSPVPGGTPRSGRRCRRTVNPPTRADWRQAQPGGRLPRRSTRRCAGRSGPARTRRRRHRRGRRRRDGRAMRARSDGSPPSSMRRRAPSGRG